MGSPSLIPEIKMFTISGRPIGLAADHAYLRFEVKDGCTKDVYAMKSGLARYLFTRETIDVYSCGVYNGMLDLDPFAPLEELTQPKVYPNHCIKQPQMPSLTQWPITPNSVE